MPDRSPPFEQQYLPPDRHELEWEPVRRPKTNATSRCETAAMRIITFTKLVIIIFTMFLVVVSPTFMSANTCPMNKSSCRDTSALNYSTR